MYAVARRCYKEAVLIFHRVRQLVEDQVHDEGVTDDDVMHSILMEYLYPANSPLDHNPLYVLCCNDTCSYTWTKEKHINQDIYECKTCGLTGSLCCCSECARTCHAGHECVLKKTSPTAYCDCLEKCPCRGQVAGDQEKRMEMLELLLQNTKLATYATGKGEHLLQFLCQTVARQVKEQAQLATIEDDSSLGRSKRLDDDIHETSSSSPRIAPPTFCRLALTRTLSDWPAVNSLIMNDKDTLCASFYATKQAPEDRQQLESQKVIIKGLSTVIPDAKRIDLTTFIFFK